MKNIVYLEADHPLILTLNEALSRADLEGKHVRLWFGQDSNRYAVKYKIGEGMWSASYYSDIDPNRG